MVSVSALKTSSLFARGRTQVRHLWSRTLLTERFPCGDSNRCNLSPVAKNINRIAFTRLSVPGCKICCDFSLQQSVPAAQIAQLSGNVQPMTSDPLICDQFRDHPSNLEMLIQTLNRNARRPKKANKGSRPCSRAGRRRRKEKIGKRNR